MDTFFPTKNIFNCLTLSAKHAIVKTWEAFNPMGPATPSPVNATAKMVWQADPAIIVAGCMPILVTEAVADVQRACSLWSMTRFY